MKRIFDLSFDDYFNLSKKDLIETIKLTEGRSVMAEAIVSTNPFVDGISNAELAAAFSADMVTLNFFNFDSPFIFGYDDNKVSYVKDVNTYMNYIKEKSIQNAKDDNYIQDFKKLVGRFVGVNLEPVKEGFDYPDGLKFNEKNLKRFKTLGFDYVIITANPKTSITSDDITEGIKFAKKILGNDTLIIAGKMHGAGTGNIYDENIIKDFINAGADIILTPAPGTVLGMTLEKTENIIETIHKNNALAMTTIGTSQEGSDKAFIENTAVLSKMAGADIQHIGDAGVAGIAPPENIFALSKAIRGMRHTYRVMAKNNRK